MRILDVGGLPTSLGEIILYKTHLDSIKHNYDLITLSFHKKLLDEALIIDNEKRQIILQYLSDIGKLFFSEPPYQLIDFHHKFAGDITTFLQHMYITPKKPDLANLLCKGTALDINEPYIVMTTKVRDLHSQLINSNLWNVLRQVSQKYKIVILGERNVEMRREYEWLRNRPFCIYNEIVQALPKDRLIDLSIPTLGNTFSSLKQIQQDCLIMNQARATITIGIGGNTCMSQAVSKYALGYRTDNAWLNEMVYNKEYNNALITKDWNLFIDRLLSL